MECASCKSENIQKLSVAYMAGASKTKGIGAGLGMGGGVGLGVGVGTNQTLLSRLVAPPKISSSSMNAFSAWILINAVGLFLLTAIAKSGPSESVIMALAFMIFAASCWFAYKAYRKYEAINKVILDEYNKKYICLRCGNIFALEKI
jgi:hypothetical protein